MTANDLSPVSTTTDRIAADKTKTRRLDGRSAAARPRRSDGRVSPCRNGDARCVAIRIVEAERARSLAEIAIAYGTRSSMTIGIGIADGIAVEGPVVNRLGGDGRPTASGETDPWIALSDFVAGHKAQHVLGYLGFDMHAVVRRRYGRLATHPAALLVVPRRVYRATADAVSVTSGELFDAAGDGECRCGSFDEVSALTYDREHPGAYCRQVETALEWISGESGRRLTVARRIAADSDVPILESMACGHMASPISRCFYVGTPQLEFAGVSPELLADGGFDGFRSYKLAGTYRRSDDSDLDDRLRQEFLADPKLRREHESGASAFAAALAGLGQVRSSGPDVLDLPDLRHLMTVFETRPGRPVAVLDCLRAVLPTGASPVEAGLDRLELLEPEPRGAYYGLVGAVAPGGGFSFSQTLRAVFRDGRGCCFWSGAAVTEGSSPAAEYEETRLKLSSIHVARRS